MININIIVLSLAVVAEPRSLFLHTVLEKTFRQLTFHFKPLLTHQSKTVLVLFCTPFKWPDMSANPSDTFSQPSADLQTDRRIE